MKQFYEGEAVVEMGTGIEGTVTSIVPDEEVGQCFGIEWSNSPDTWWYTPDDIGKKFNKKG